MSKITVYSTPFCAPCERLKKLLKELGIEFENKDLMMDADAAEQIEGLGIRTSPVLEIDGNFYAGADITPDNLLKILEVGK